MGKRRKDDLKTKLSWKISVKYWKINWVLIIIYWIYNFLHYLQYKLKLTKNHIFQYWLTLKLSIRETNESNTKKLKNVRLYLFIPKEAIIATVWVATSSLIFCLSLNYYISEIYFINSQHFKVLSNHLPRF